MGEVMDQLKVINAINVINVAFFVVINGRKKRKNSVQTPHSCLTMSSAIYQLILKFFYSFKAERKCTLDHHNC